MAVSLSPHAGYVDRVLALYRCTPGTTGHARGADRRLAAAMGSRRIPLVTVQSALLLATARRTLRPSAAQPLPPIATLHYFLPVIEELLATPADHGYLDYLRLRLAPLAPALVAPLDHQLP